MNAVHYGKPVDLWSVGCILAEVLGRGVMFRGASYIHQLQLIVQQCGTPSRQVLTTMMADLPDQERPIPSGDKPVRVLRPSSCADKNSVVVPVPKRRAGGWGPSQSATAFDL